ncbi:autotransporter assembly complex family protein [Plastorhodobacter daqingensis]|uniref:Autotransporter assembly complex family protein n=1 Tax=Plastorhodobacter daqingensis TaxID=1387281 RepID=A0ABW2UQR2_9RHOB
MTGRLAKLRLGLAAAALFTLQSWPGQAQDLVRLTAPGADEELLDLLRNASLALQQQENGATTAQELLAAARSDYGRLVGVLYGAGHYSGVVQIRVDGREAATIPPLSAPSQITLVEVLVAPGPQFTFSRAEIAPLAPDTELPDGFAVGQPAESNLIRDAATAAVDGWRAVGHAKAATGAQQITADHRSARLSAQVSMVPGPRVTFGDLVVTGQRRMRPERIQEIAGFPTGEVFDPEAIARSADRLRRTGVFRSVALSEADDLRPGDVLDVTAAVVEELPRRLGFGAEIASTDGARVTAYWMHRNLRGGGERLRLDAEVGGIGAQSGGLDYGLTARLDRPATFTPDTSVFVFTGVERTSERDYDADRAFVSVGLAHQFTDRITGEVALDLRYERVEDELGRITYSTLALPTRGIWDRRNSTLNPTGGTFLEATVTPFAGLSDAAGHGARLSFDGRAYRGFGSDDRFVVAGRVQGGSVIGAGLFETPREFLFYSGGGGTVRGHPFQSLGVETPYTGTRPSDGATFLRTGGRSFLGASAELRARVWRSIGLVGFADAGFVGADSFGDGEWHAGAGIGIRYDTGIGPIRLDVAAPVRGDSDDGVQVYIGIGQAF